jgi:hypothetical protein
MSVGHPSHPDNQKRSIMRKFCVVATVLATVVSASSAFAQTFSTSALKPSPIPSDGVIAGGYPQGGDAVTYYFAADLNAGQLATQISFMGRPGPDRSLEIALFDPSGKRVGGYFIMSSVDANQEQARVLPIDRTGRHVIHVVAKGPETTKFRIELGGTALAIPRVTSVTEPFSRSFLAPKPAPVDGVIAGPFPPSEEGMITHYYFSANLKSGKLLTQLSFAGRKVTGWTVDKMAEFAVLNSKGISVGSYFIMSSIEANQQATKAIPIDNSGPYVLRISLKGPESTSFKLELGGDSFAAR